MLRRSLGKNVDAVTDLNRAIQLNPGLGIAYLERARAKAQLGDKVGAQQDYQLAAQHGRQMEAFDQNLMK